MKQEKRYPEEQPETVELRENSKKLKSLQDKFTEEKLKEFDEKFPQQIMENTYSGGNRIDIEGIISNEYKMIINNILFDIKSFISKTIEDTRKAERERIQFNHKAEISECGNYVKIGENYYRVEGGDLVKLSLNK